MAELSYVEHLNIPHKYRGSILHSYEYNATVEKINEIVDNLYLTYEYSKDFPKFDKVNDIFASTGSGTPTIISNNGEKLYPITSTAYVIVEPGKNLETTLQELNSQISSGINDAYSRIMILREMLDNKHNLAYAYTVSKTNELAGNVNNELSTLRTLIDELGGQLTEMVNELVETHTIDINNIISYIPSYLAGDGINIDENNTISVDSSYLIDDNTIKLVDGKMMVNVTAVSSELGEELVATNARIDDLSQSVDDRLNDVNDKIDNMSVPSYIAGDGIDISNENVISVKPTDLVDNRTIYVNELGKLVVNGDEILVNAETKFKFIDENGNWVGDMANVKNYIDNSVNNLDSSLGARIDENAANITALRNDMNTEINNMYSYTDKFAVYDTFGKQYGLSEEFIQSQE